MSPLPSLSARRARRCLAAGVALGATLLLGCEGSTTEPAFTMRIETLAKASVPAQTPARVREVVRDPARYAAVWRELWGDREVARPAVDFQRDMVVVVTHPFDACMGEVAIERVDGDSWGATIQLGESRPHLCLCAAAETTFHVVRAPRLGGPVDFETHPIPSRCGAGGS